MLSQLLGFLLLLTPLAVVADVASIQNALNVINEGLRRGDLAIIGLPATAQSLVQLQAQAIPLLENATTVISASAPLDFDDSQSLVIATQALRFNLNISINDLIAQKPLLDAAGQSSTLSTALTAEGNVTLRLSSTLLSKLDPDATQAQASLAQVAEFFNRAVALLRDPSGLNASTITLSGPFDPTADLSPVFLPLTQPPVTGTGTIGPDNSCNCVAVCPAGSFMQ